MSDIIDQKPDAVFDWYTRPKPNPEINSGEEIVEKDGYIPADVQIMNMIQAGERLGEYRREMYDYGAGEEVPDTAIDTRSFTDPVDAQRALDVVNARMAKAAEAQSESVAAEDENVVEPPKGA